PMRGACKKFAGKPCVQCMAGFIGDKAAKYWLADQGKVTQQIESFVANKLIWEAQGGIVQHTRLCEDDCIFQRSAADKAAGLQFLNFMIEAESASRRDEIGVVRSGELDIEALSSNQGMGEINVIPDTESISRIDAQRLLAFIEDELFRNSNVLPRATL